MSHYLCRLLDPEGEERNLVPIIGSSIRDAKVTARAVYQALGSQGSYEIWNDTTRLVAHAELEDLPPPETKTPPRRPKKTDFGPSPRSFGPRIDSDQG
jgi:hypothetical protein